MRGEAIVRFSFSRPNEGKVTSTTSSMENYRLVLYKKFRSVPSRVQ